MTLKVTSQHGETLVASDIPDLAASKITSGTIPSDRIASDAVTAAKLADQSVTKFGGAGATDNIVTFPDGDFKGQFFFDEKNEDLYIYTGHIVPADHGYQRQPD